MVDILLLLSTQHYSLTTVLNIPTKKATNFFKDRFYYVVLASASECWG